MTTKQMVVKEIVDNVNFNSSKEILELQLYEVLKGYDITEATTEIMCQDNSYVCYLNLFLAYKLTEGKSEKTIEQYNMALRDMLYTINKNIKDITEDDVFLYLSKIKNVKKISNVTLDNKRRIFSSFFNWCELKGYVSCNVVKKISAIKKEQKKKESYTDEELEILKKYASSQSNELKRKRDLALLELLYSTGARVSEVSRLNISDIDFNNKTAITHGKGAKDNEVYLTSVALYYLKDYLNSRTDDNDALFVHVKEPFDRLQKGGIEEIIRNMGKKCNIKSYPHKFRRTMATNLLNKGMPVQEVSSILNHKSLDTTMIYCNVKRESIKYNHTKFMSM